MLEHFRWRLNFIYVLLLSKRHSHSPYFFLPVEHHATQVCCNCVVSISLFIITSLRFSICHFSTIPWGRWLCRGKWQPSPHRLLAPLIICMALIIDWLLHAKLCDGLFLIWVSFPRSFHLSSFASIYTPAFLVLSRCISRVFAQFSLYEFTESF